MQTNLSSEIYYNNFFLFISGSFGINYPLYILASPVKTAAANWICAFSSIYYIRFVPMNLSLLATRYQIMTSRLMEASVMVLSLMSFRTPLTLEHVEKAALAVRHIDDSNMWLWVWRGEALLPLTHTHTLWTMLHEIQWCFNVQSVKPISVSEGVESRLLWTFADGQFFQAVCVLCLSLKSDEE